MGNRARRPLRCGTLLRRDVAQKRAQPLVNRSPVPRGICALLVRRLPRWCPAFRATATRRARPRLLTPLSTVNDPASSNGSPHRRSRSPIANLKCSISFRSAPTLSRLCRPPIGGLGATIVFSFGRDLETGHEVHECTNQPVVSRVKRAVIRPASQQRLQGATVRRTSSSAPQDHSTGRSLQL
jgi:hypothetical protein